jgi:hypothetical protein
MGSPSVRRRQTHHSMYICGNHGNPLKHVLTPQDPINAQFPARIGHHGLPIAWQHSSIVQPNATHVGRYRTARRKPAPQFCRALQRAPAERLRRSCPRTTAPQTVPDLFRFMPLIAPEHTSALPALHTPGTLSLTALYHPRRMKPGRLQTFRVHAGCRASARTHRELTRSPDRYQAILRRRRR